MLELVSERLRVGLSTETIAVAQETLEVSGEYFGGVCARRGHCGDLPLGSEGGDKGLPSGLQAEPQSSPSMLVVQAEAEVRRW